MSYNEHFNYNNCSTGVTYTDTHKNYCATSYTNTHKNYCATYYTNTHRNYCATYYTNTHRNYCATSHDNHRNWNNSGTSHNNYVNDCSVYYNNFIDDCSVYYNNFIDDCSTSHNNAVDDCSTTAVYTNHFDYVNPNSGVPTTLTWSSPWNGDILDVDKIQDSIPAIKELRDKLNGISTGKGQINTGTDLLESSPNVGDDEFDDSNANTNEYVEDNQYDGLRDSLNSLWADLRGDAVDPPIQDRAPGDAIQKSDWQNIKKATDNLSNYDASAAYANHMNYTAT